MILLFLCGSSTGVLLLTDEYFPNFYVRDPQAGSGKLHIAAVGRALSSASSSLELRRLSVDNDDSYGFFITNGSLAPLFVNGISIGMNMVAGPLPDFAVIEAEDVVFFWWCTLQGISYIPKDLPTVQVSIFPSMICVF